MADNKIEIEVALNTEKIEKDWSRLAKTSGNEAEKASAQGQKSFKDTEKQSQNSSKKVGEHWKAASGIAKNALKSGMGGAKKVIRKTTQILVDAGTAAVKTGITFENAFAGVKKTVNASDKEMEQLRKGILDMSKELPESASEIAAVAEEAGKLGIKSNGILGFTKTMIQLGDSTSLSTEEAATSLSKLADITQMPQTEFSRLGSTVVALSGQLDTSEKKITDMAVEIAGAGHEAGMSETEILSFAGILSSAGQEAEAGSTAFSQLTSKMNRAAASGGNDLNEFARISGTSSEQFKKAFQEDAAGAVGSFLQGLDQINQNGGNTVKTLENLGLSDVQVQDTLLKAAEASGTFTETLAAGNQAWSDNTALQDKAGQQYETTENKISTLSNKFSQLGISIFDNVNNPIREAIDVVSGYVDQLQEVFDKKGLEGLAGELGSIFANLAEDVAKQAPALIKTASQVVKAFISGLVKNGPKIQSAAKSLVKSLAGGIADVLPKEMGTAFRNLSNILIQVADKGITVLAKSLGFIAENFKIILPLIASTVAAVKTLLIVKSVVSAIDAAKTATESATVTTTLLKTALSVVSGEMKAAEAATLLCSKALAALGGPIGIAVIAIGALAAGIVAYNLTVDRTSELEKRVVSRQKSVNKSYQDLTKKLQENKKARDEAIHSAGQEGKKADKLFQKLQQLTKIENKSTGQKKQIKTIVDQLNEVLPDLNLNYDAENDKLNKSTSSIRKNIKAQKELLKAKAYAKQQEKTIDDIVETEEKQEKYIKEQEAAYEDLQKAKKKMGDAEQKSKDSGYGKVEEAAFAKAQKEAIKAEQAYKDITDKVDKTKKKLKELNGEYDSLGKKEIASENFAEYTANINKLAKEAGIKAKEIPESIGKGIQDGIYAGPQTGKDLLKLIDLDTLRKDVIAKSKDTGIDIPKKLSEGIASGSISYKDAIKQMSNLSDFQDAINKAGLAGVEIPKKLTEGIANGKYAVPQSIEQIQALIKFDQLANTAFQNGVKIPKEISKGIASGEMAPSEAVKQLQDYINFDSMITNFGLAGDKSVKDLVAKLNNGDISLQQAMSGIKNIVSEDAKQVPLSFGNGMMQNMFAVDESSNQMTDTVKQNTENIDTTSGGTNVVQTFGNGITLGLPLLQTATDLFKTQLQQSVNTDLSPEAGVTGMSYANGFMPILSYVDTSAGSLKTTAIEATSGGTMAPNGINLGKSFNMALTEQAGGAKTAGGAYKKKAKEGASGGTMKKEANLLGGSFISTLLATANKAQIAGETVKKAGTKALQNTSGYKSAGAKAGEAYASGITSKSSQVAAKGKELSDKTASGVTANKGKIKTAAQTAVNGAKSVSVSGFTSVGKNIAKGIASGINNNSAVVSVAAAKVIREAKNAANQEADSHSPSRVFRDQVGKYLPLGMAVGITKNTSKVVQATKEMTQASINAARNDLQIHSPSIKFDKIVGRNIPKGIAKGIKKEQKSVVSATKSMIESLEKAAKNPFGKFEQTGTTFVDKFEETLNKKKDSSIKAIKKLVDDQVKALKKQNKSKSKDYTKAGKSIVSAYTKAITSETKKLVTKAEKEIEEISKKFQEDYDHIKSMQDGLEDKQKSYGNIYDLDQNIADIKQYQNNLKALENKIPDSMMEHILGMNIEDATEYMEWFRSLSAAEQKAYTDKWKQQESMSENFSKSFFADDISRLNKEYSKKINEATAGLEKQMKNIGKNIMRGMAKGMKSETKNLNKTIRDICNKVVKAAKKKLGVNSPSRVFAEIGKYNIQGAEQGQEKEAPKLYKQMEHVADTMAEKFAKAQMNIPRLQDKLQAAVARQSAKFMANVQPQIIYAGGGSDTTKIEKTVYTGPEKIELVTTLNGREIARGSAPFLNQEFEAIAKHQERGG